METANLCWAESREILHRKPASVSTGSALQNIPVEWAEEFFDLWWTSSESLIPTMHPDTLDAFISMRSY